MVPVRLDLGASTHHAEIHVSTPLHIACHKGHEAVVRVLLDRGASIDQAENDGATPLHIACHKGHEAVVPVHLDCQIGRAHV